VSKSLFSGKSKTSCEILCCRHSTIVLVIIFGHADFKILKRNEKQLLILLVIIYLNMGWIKVCDADSLSNGDLIAFDYNNIKKILITKLQDKIYATDGICTHEYADLSTDSKHC
jgi:hypothetical protein